MTRLDTTQAMTKFFDELLKAIAAPFRQAFEAKTLQDWSYADQLVINIPCGCDRGTTFASGDQTECYLCVRDRLGLHSAALWR